MMKFVIWSFVFIFFGCSIDAKPTKLNVFSCDEHSYHLCGVRRIYINPCQRVVEEKTCIVDKGTYITLTFEYIPHFVTTALKWKIYTITIIGDFPLRSIDENACLYTKCPTRPHRWNHFNATVFVPEFLRAKRYVVKIMLTGNATNDNCCFKGEIRVREVATWKKLYGHHTIVVPWEIQVPPMYDLPHRSAKITTSTQFPGYMPLFKKTINRWFGRRIFDDGVCLKIENDQGNKIEKKDNQTGTKVVGDNITAGIEANITSKTVTENGIVIDTRTSVGNEMTNNEIITNNKTTDNETTKNYMVKANKTTDNETTENEMVKANKTTDNETTENDMVKANKAIDNETTENDMVKVNETDTNNTLVSINETSIETGPEESPSNENYTADESALNNTTPSKETIGYETLNGTTTCDTTITLPPNKTDMPETSSTIEDIVTSSTSTKITESESTTKKEATIKFQVTTKKEATIKKETASEPKITIQKGKVIKPETTPKKEATTVKKETVIKSQVTTKKDATTIKKETASKPQVTAKTEVTNIEQEITSKPVVEPTKIETVSKSAVTTQKEATMTAEKQTTITSSTAKQNTTKPITQFSATKNIPK